MPNPRAKGNRSVRRAIEYYEKKGWLVDKVEKTGKWVIEKDLFNLFDLICLKRNKVTFVQVKTNRPPTQKDYIQFAQKYCGKRHSRINIEVYTWYDRKGPVVHKFYQNGGIKREDLRK